jgi:hypothetical protein
MERKIRLGNMGQSTAIDIGMLTMIIIIALTFLQMYSITHASTSTKNFKEQIMTEYAQHALLSLSYVSPTGADYSTVQPDAVGNTYLGEVEELINASLVLRNYTNRTDALLENWSENITASTEEIINSIDVIKSNISKLRSEVKKESDSLSVLGGMMPDCENTTKGLNSFADLIGGTTILTDSCDYVSGLARTVNDTLNVADNLLYQSETKLGEVKYYVASDADMALKAIQDARCVLREANVKIDYFISYAQLGLKDNVSLLTTMPATASIDSKTVTEVIGESLYIEDRLAESSLVGTAATAGLKLYMSGEEYSTDSKDNVMEGAVLAYGRKSYLSLAQTAVENKFDVILTKQGYSYCFTAKDCCSKVTAGECDNIPYNSARASRTISTLGKESAEMTLDIWRKK